MSIATIKQQRIKRGNRRVEEARVHFCLPAPLKEQLMDLARIERKSLALLVRELVEPFADAVQSLVKEGVNPREAIEKVRRTMLNSLKTMRKQLP